MTSCFFRYNFWGVNNMYLGLRGGGILYPWRKGVFLSGDGNLSETALSAQLGLSHSRYGSDNRTVGVW